MKVFQLCLYFIFSQQHLFSEETFYLIDFFVSFMISLSYGYIHFGLNIPRKFLNVNISWWALENSLFNFEQKFLQPFAVLLIEASNFAQIFGGKRISPLMKVANMQSMKILHFRKIHSGIFIHSVNSDQIFNKALINFLRT